jgi:hypothetical protein
MNLEELSKTIVGTRKFEHNNDLEVFLQAMGQLLDDFKYENLKYILLGFDDNTNDPSVMSNILIGEIEYHILDNNPVQFIQQLLMNYELMLPHAEEWLSMLFTGSVIFDVNIFKVYTEELNFLEISKKEKLKNIYQCILGNEIKLLERPINKRDSEYRKKVIKKVEYILEVLDAET